MSPFSFRNTDDISREPYNPTSTVMTETETQKTVAGLLPARKGHFRLESGHHGELWLDLELLCLHPQHIQGLAGLVAKRIATHRVEAVCGPLIEGAFVALMVASELGVPFVYTERFAGRGFADQEADALFPVQHRLPQVLRCVVRGKRVAIVNDVINAGSAIRGTFADLNTCGAEPVVIAALAVLGTLPHNSRPTINCRWRRWHL